MLFTTLLRGGASYHQLDIWAGFDSCKACLSTTESVALMGSGSLHQWVAWGAVLIVVVVIFIAVGEEKGNKPSVKNKAKRGLGNGADLKRSAQSDTAAQKFKSTTPDTEEAARDFALAQASKVLIPPPGEKRIEAVAPRNLGRNR